VAIDSPPTPAVAGARPAAVRRFRAACAAWLAVAATATVIGVAERWPAQFAGTGQPSKVSTEWLTQGTVLSPPLFMMIALAIAVILAIASRRRAATIAAGVIAILVGAVAAVFTVGEALSASAAVPGPAHLGSLIGTLLSLAVVAASVPLLRSAS
jgi:hypothetical protein